MIVPPEIVYRGIEKTEAMETLIQEDIQRLERYCDHINSCRVAVESRHQHQHSGQPYRIRIDMRVPPGHEVVASKDSSEGDIHDPLETVIKEAFDAAERQLKKITGKQRGETKQHPEQRLDGLVSKIFRDEGYGFIQSLDGREIYFHRNSLLNHDFERLHTGTGVRYAEEQGEEGPQASTVHIVDKPVKRTASL